MLHMYLAVEITRHVHGKSRGERSRRWWEEKGWLIGAGRMCELFEPKDLECESTVSCRFAVAVTHADWLLNSIFERKKLLERLPDHPLGHRAEDVTPSREHRSL